MISVIRLAVLATCLAGCTAFSETDGVVLGPDEVPGGGSCVAESFQSLVGQQVADIGSITGPSSVRVAYPWQAVTNDLNPSRLNLLVDERGIVHTVTCG